MQPLRLAVLMHPQLTLDNNPLCVEQILAFKRCHEETTYFQRMLGACNQPKQELDWCFKAQKKVVRKDHLIQARADREKWRKACEELEPTVPKISPAA